MMSGFYLDWHIWIEKCFLSWSSIGYSKYEPHNFFCWSSLCLQPRRSPPYQLLYWTWASTSTALRLSLPNLTCVTFRVFSSLKCDWKRKTMHWSSLDSVLLSALQRKCVGKMGRGKINHIYITLSGWFKKKPQKDITPLSGCHESIGLATPCLLGSGLCEPTEHVHSEGQNNPEVQHSFSNLWVLGQRRTINDDIKVVGRSRQTQSIGSNTGGKCSLVTASNDPVHHWRSRLEMIKVSGNP